MAQRRESVRVPPAASPSDWRARLAEAVGPLGAVQPLGANAWSVEAGGRMLVAKVGPGARDEADGLRRLGAVHAGPPVPGIVFADDELVVTIAVEQSARTPAHEEWLGRALAALHAMRLDHWGGGSAWIGACRVDASTWPDGAAFYGARLGALAARCGLEEPVARVVNRLPQLLPAGGPALLHGDLWWGNVLFGADGRAWLIDPSVHGGHPEEDLAMLALFGPVPERLLAAYQEVTPRQPEWKERVALFQLYPLLVHTVLFGGGYRAQAEAAARRFS
jgi:fructosamine-3-kinase